MKNIFITFGVIALSLFLVGTVHATQIVDWDNDTPIPTVEVTPTDVPTPTSCVIWEGEFPIPCPTDTVAPTPTDTPTNTGSGVSDGRSDGLGCASHDCSVHVTVPKGAPATGRG